MGLNISGVAVNYNSSASALEVTNNAKVMGWRTDGAVLTANTPMFTAGGTNSTLDPAITPGNGWRKLVFSAVPNNVGNCFASNRFTAPVSGAYFFSANCYCVGSVANAEYVHGLFYVNGSSGTRRNGQTGYRISGFGRPAGLSFDTQVNEIYQLVAGDYVEAYVYVSTATTTLYQYYSGFNGIFLG